MRRRSPRAAFAAASVPPPGTTSPCTHSRRPSGRCSHFQIGTSRLICSISHSAAAKASPAVGCHWRRPPRSPPPARRGRADGPPPRRPSSKRAAASPQSRCKTCNRQRLVGLVFEPGGRPAPSVRPPGRADKGDVAAGGRVGHRREQGRRVQDRAVTAASLTRDIRFAAWRPPAQPPLTGGMIADRPRRAGRPQPSAA